MSPASATSIGVRSMPAERQDLRDAARLDDVAVVVEDLDVLVRLDAARLDAPRDQAAEIGVRLEQRAEHAKRRAVLDRRGRYVLQHKVEQWRHAVLRAIGLVGHPSVAARAVEDREVELVVVGVERGEQVEHVVDHLLNAGIRPVDLVDRHNRAQAQLQRLADDEFRLRHRALGRVDQHDHAVDHRQDALHLAAEIGVAGSVDDVDAGVLPDDRGHLGQDGDAALLFEVVRIHHALGDALVLAE